MKSYPGEPEQLHYSWLPILLSLDNMASSSVFIEMPLELEGSAEGEFSWWNKKLFKWQQLPSFWVRGLFLAQEIPIDPVVEGFLCSSASLRNPIQRHNWSILGKQQQGVYCVCLFAWADNMSPSLFSACCFVLLYQSWNSYLHEKLLQQEKAETGVHPFVAGERCSCVCCYTNTSGTGKLLTCPRAVTKLPSGEAAVRQGERAGKPEHDADVESLLLEQ